MPPRTGTPGEPAVVTRLRGLPGGVLLPVPPDDAAGKYVVPEGVAGEIEVLLGRARPQEALARLETADLPELLTRTLRARAFLMDGRVDDARDALGDRKDDEVRLGDAALALAEGDLGRAAGRLALFLTEFPDHVGANYLMALVRVSQGDMHEGGAVLAEVARSVPSHTVARFQLGQILYAQGDPARAGTLYEMAWDLEPTFISPPLALCEMLVESRQYGEALSILERVCHASPLSLPPRQLQLRILLELGEREAAVDLGRRLHEQVPEDHDTTLLLADALIDAERNDEAKALLGALVDAPGVDAGQAVRAQRLRARILLSQRNVDEALELLRSAAQRAPQALIGEVCLELAQVGVAQGRMEDVDLGLSLLVKCADVSSLVSGALLARQHQLTSRARALAGRARDLVPGTPAAAQLEGFIAALG